MSYGGAFFHALSYGRISHMSIVIFLSHTSTVAIDFLSTISTWLDYWIYGAHKSGFHVVRSLRACFIYRHTPSTSQHIPCISAYMTRYTKCMSVFDKCHRNPDNLKYWLRFHWHLGYTYTNMWRGYRGNRLRPCFPTDVWQKYGNRHMADSAICHSMGKGQAICHSMKKRPIIYLVYTSIYQVYTGLYPQYTVYVYDSIYQVYTSI